LQKPLDKGIPVEVYARAKKLHKAGHSYRDIEKILFAEGHNVAASSICRAMKGQLKKVKR
jgi:hypothetical protein